MHVLHGMIARSPCPRMASAPRELPDDRHPPDRGELQLTTGAEAPWRYRQPALCVAEQLPRASADPHPPVPGACRLEARWMMPTGAPELPEVWEEVIEPEVELLREDADRAASATGAVVAVDAKQGSPPESLIALSGDGRSRRDRVTPVWSRSASAARAYGRGTDAQRVLLLDGCPPRTLHQPAALQCSTREEPDDL